MRERREHTRHETGGHLEITSVIGGTTPPSTQGRLLNCSRSGALFRLASPSRRFFKKRPAPALCVRDSITCVLRLPPAYASIEMFGEVVRVIPDPVQPGQFDVGLRFFHDVSRRTVMNPQLDALGMLLEPRKLKAEAEALHERRLEDNARRSARQRKQAEEEEPLSCSEAARLVAQTSQRLKAQAVEVSDPDEEEPLSCSEAARMVSQASQRLKRARDPQETQRLKQVGDSRRQKAVARDPRETQRLKQVRDPQETQRLRKASGRHAGAGSARLRRKPSQRVSLDTSTLRRLEDSRLLESAIRTPTLGAWAQARLHTVSEPRLLDFGGQLGVRGRAVLHNGGAVIALPEAFVARVEPGTATVHLTPRGPAALYVSEVEPERVLVEGVQNRGSGPVEFDYLVIADRGAPLRA